MGKSILHATAVSSNQYLNFQQISWFSLTRSQNRCHNRTTNVAQINLQARAVRDSNNCSYSSRGVYYKTMQHG